MEQNPTFMVVGASQSNPPLSGTILKTDYTHSIWQKFIKLIQSSKIQK
jgi:hypothetical protein